MEKILGKQLRLISKKEENKDHVMASIVSVDIATNELFVCNVSKKPNLLSWEVRSSTTTVGAVKFVNVQTGTFLMSILPSFEVKVGDDASVVSDWKLFTKSGGVKPSLIPYTDSFVALDDVWIQSLNTQGFLSVRSNEAWTSSGKIWTRGAEQSPAGAFSWERFQIQLIGNPTKRDILKENELLRTQLNAAQLEIQELKADRRLLEEYKIFFLQFKKLSDMNK